jgi:hypothetical protein
MIKNNSVVTSLETARQLKEAGIDIKTQFAYVNLQSKDMNPAWELVAAANAFKGLFSRHDGYVMVQGCNRCHDKFNLTYDNARVCGGADFIPTYTFLDLWNVLRSKELTDSQGIVYYPIMDGNAETPHIWLCNEYHDGLDETVIVDVKDNNITEAAAAMVLKAKEEGWL